jgi:hypothetical protein
MHQAEIGETACPTRQQKTGRVTDEFGNLDGFLTTGDAFGKSAELDEAADQVAAGQNRWQNPLAQTIATQLAFQGCDDLPEILDALRVVGAGDEGLPKVRVRQHLQLAIASRNAVGEGVLASSDGSVMLCHPIE